MTSAAQLLDCLRRLHLLEPAQLNELTGLLQGQGPDARALARQLIDRGWLTPYQVNQLFLGRGDGLLLGSYVLLERVGEGGMGAVFKARNWKLGRVVALKVIKRDRLTNETAVKRFRRETEAAAQLDHPHIVHAFDAGEENGSHFLVMEYVAGTDLAKLVAERGPLPVAGACDCVRQAALGLQHAHERGLVHRDLKPSNLLLTAGGTVKVLDMGLARLAQADDGAGNTSTLTQEGAMMGTPDYVAPEQTLDAHSADVRSDLYSLGCTLYFLLTGYPPFPGGTLGEKIARHLAREPVPVEQLRREVPAEVAAVVRKLMAKRPDQRYQTPAELAAALAPFTAGAAAPPAATDTMPEAASPWAQLDAPSTTEDGGRPPRRRRSPWPWLAAAGGLALLAVVAVLIWRPWRGRPAAPGPAAVTPQTRPMTPQAQAEEALKPLAARLTEALKDGAPPAQLAELLPQLRAFPRQHTGTPAAERACRLLGRALARSPSPLDALDAAKLPDELRRRWAAAGVKPPVVAVLGEPRRRHGGAVKALAFTPDGKAVRSVGADRLTDCWDLEKDTHHYVALPVAPGDVWEPLAVSPDAALLAATVGANASGGIKLWDLTTGRERVALEDIFHGFQSAAFTPDGKVLYAISYYIEHTKTALWTWDVATGKKKAVYSFSIGWPDPHRFAFAPDGKSIALAYCLERTETSSVMAVKLWVPGADKERVLFKGPGDQFLAVAFSPDGRTVAAKRYGGQVLAWDAATGKELFTLEGNDRVNHGLAFSPDGKLLAAGDGRLLDAASGKVRFTLPPGGVPAFAPDGKMLAYGGPDGGVRLWDVATGKELRPLPGATGPALRVALSPDSRTAAAGYRDGARVWDVLTGKELRFRPGTQRDVRALAFSPDGKTLAIVGNDPRDLVFLDLASGQETRGGRDPGDVLGSAFSPDGTMFVTSHGGGGLDLWAVPDGKHQRNVPAPTSFEPAFSPDGRVLAVGCGDRAVHFYEAATGRPLGALENGEQAVWRVAFAAHGQALAGRDYDGKVALWDLRTKKKKHDVGRAARGPAFSPDGRLLATWGDGGVTLWDGGTGRQLRELAAPGPVRDLAFAADGRHLATANDNGTVSVWRLPPDTGP